MGLIGTLPPGRKPVRELSATRTPTLQSRKEVKTCPKDGEAKVIALARVGSSPRRLALPYRAAWPAARAFTAYRRRGGKRTAPLPDFFIGAHVLVEGLTLLTRDARRYRTYFPRLRLIAPT